MQIGHKKLPLGPIEISVYLMALPDWVNIGEYPFKAHHFEVDGQKMHYVDEGKGHPVLMLHGTPTWSYLYRNLVKGLMDTHRCIVPDMLGFGLSGKDPKQDYRPEKQVQRLRQFIDSLDIESFTLVVHDFGGIIGLAYATQFPEKIKRIVLSNSFMWSLKDDKQVRQAYRMFNTWLGRFLYLRMNFSAKVMLKQAYGNRKLLTRELHQHYLKPFPNKSSRYATWAYLQSLMKSDAFFKDTWDQRNQIADIPTLILWGLQDKFFGMDKLERFEELFQNSKVLKLAAGHFVQDEAKDEYIQHIREFLLAYEGKPA